MFISVSTADAADLPPMYDLRSVGGVNYVTSVKNQVGGTCWAHAVMAAIEGNLMMTGVWTEAGDTGEPNLAEYHLDWWNGFNSFNNDDLDPPVGGELSVHWEGDFRIATAYTSRGEGAVRDIDGQSYSTPPPRYNSSFHVYYPRDVEFLQVGADLSNIKTVKRQIMTGGAAGTYMYYAPNYMTANFVHYQPPSDTAEPNHVVAIVGWDDGKVTQAPNGPGAWLCKNSWGSGWGLDGYFWISYYDRHCGQYPGEGVLSFRNVELLAYNHIYYHDYHGWAASKPECQEAFNAFTATGTSRGDEWLRSVSFFVNADSVSYAVKIHDRFADSTLSDELASKSGVIDYKGFHTVNLDAPIALSPGNDFYVYLYLSAGGQPYDRTRDLWRVSTALRRVPVQSTAKPGQSFYRDGAVWRDLYETDTTANFCIKALTSCDSDLDGFLDYQDNCPLAGNPDQADADNDGVGDVCDNCPKLANAQQGDMDADGIGDLCDPDLDGDGTSNESDNCPNISNPEQSDSDGDGVGDVCDNCISTDNPEQNDENSDDIGDACDGLLHIESYALPSCTLSAPYYYEFWAVGGVQPYTWRQLSGDVPLGCTLTGGSTATLSGTPTWKAIYYFAIEVTSSDSPVLVDTMSYALAVIDMPYLCGDADGNGLLNISDVVHLVTYIFGGGPAPYPPTAGDADCNGAISIPDAVYLIQYIFAEGLAPCVGCK